MIAAVAVAAGCAGQADLPDSDGPEMMISPQERQEARRSSPATARNRGSTIWDLFGGGSDPNVTVAVNRYLWNASLDVLDFLPVEAADPFSGVIVFGYGSPPGSGAAYRATVYIRDPALDARSLSVSILTRGGPASLQTQRAIEDAILTRARQLRIRDAGL